MESTNITFQNDILTVEKLSKAYNNTVVLDIPNLVIKKGESFGHVSTGGGASLELMAGEKLPGVEHLLDA